MVADLSGNDLSRQYSLAIWNPTQTFGNLIPKNLGQRNRTRKVPWFSLRCINKRMTRSAHAPSSLGPTKSARMVNGVRMLARSKSFFVLKC
jgi:hypothetical protein